jgi:TolB-like protein
VLALALLVAATSPATAAVGAKVLVLDLHALAVEPATAALINGVVASAVSDHKELQVTSADDVRQMLSLAAQKQAVGCDDSSCLSEVAGAIGARYVVHGSLGKLGDTVVVNLALFDAQLAQALRKKTIQAATVEQLPAEIRPAVDELVADIPGARTVERAREDVDAGREHHAHEAASASSLIGPVGVGIGVVGALALLGGAGVAAVEGSAVYDVAHKSPQEREDALGTTWIALLVAGAGFVGVGAGAAAAVFGGSQ